MNPSHLFQHLLVGCLFCQLATAQVPTPKTPLRRADSFFGLHFDFHASMGDTAIGQTLTDGMIDSLLTLVKPDFIQVDSKGHAGVTSYPTQVGYAPKRFAKNTLKLFREVTRRHGVALYVHHSGVWDNEAVAHHPNWARINPDGKPDTQKTSLWGQYADSLLIPQLKEISDYGVDGAWVDGDCWAVDPDYSPAAMAQFRQETGVQVVPKKWGDPASLAWLAVQRQAFRQYVTHYTEALHQYNPRFQVASNWAFSSFMPEPVSIPVDFISGDTDPLDGANRSAFQARCIAPQGSGTPRKPWDLMSWSFGYSFEGNEGVGAPKPASQLCQEAAQVISMGGGFQAYWTQNRDASLTPWAFGTMAELARFCRARQPYCQHATPIPQVALLYSSVAQYARAKTVYQFNAGQSANLLGTLNALLYSQLPTEILQEHHLRGTMSRYPLIVIPEWDTLAPAFRDELVQYVRGGGKLLVMGTETVKLFRDELGVTLADKTVPATYFGSETSLTGTRSAYRPMQLKPGTKAVGGVYAQRDLRFKTGPVATIAQLGKGQIAGVYINVGEQHGKRETPTSRDLIGTLATALFQPMVRVAGSHLVNVALNQKGGQTLVNLINMAGSHANTHVHATDEIPPLGPLTLSVRYPRKPRQVRLQPGNKPLPFGYKNGEISLVLPNLAIHSIVAID